MRSLWFIAFAGCYSPDTPPSCVTRCPDDLCPDGLECNAEQMCVAPGDTRTCAFALCPASYIEVTGIRRSKYRVGGIALNMASAALSCVADDDDPGDAYHTHLVVLSNAMEYGLLTATPRSVAMTLGHNDKTSEGMYHSITLEDPTFLSPTGIGIPPWAPNEPAMAPDCAVFGTTDNLVHADLCNSARDFLCECDTYKDEPSRRM
jgi:hypothetical protein